MGRLGAPHGLRGWLHLRSFTDPLPLILDFRQHWFDPGSGRSIAVEETWHDGERVMVRPVGSEDRDAAGLMTGIDIAIPREVLPQPDKGHYYWSDLIGASVIDLDGFVYGAVDHLLDAGAHDVLVIQGNNGEWLIPFVLDSIVRDVDVRQKRIRVAWEREWL